MKDSEGAVGHHESGLDREVLLRVYEAAIDEYRFNVNLGWDRAKFFLLLNSGLIAAGVGLIKVSEGSGWTSFFLLLYFFLLIAITLLGRHTLGLAKAYYRESVFIKSVVERELGLLDDLPGLADGRRTNLSIAVTDGQRALGLRLRSPTPVEEIPAQPIQNRIAGSVRTITGTTEGIFILMIGIEVVGVLIAIANFIQATT